MAADASNRGAGFWRGFAVGVAAVAVGLLGLALAYPPAPATPPAIAPEAAIAPAPPVAPTVGAAPEGGVLGPAAPGPLVTGRPAPPAAGASPSLAPVSPPEPGASGPSLVPQPAD